MYQAELVGLSDRLLMALNDNNEETTTAFSNV